MQDAHSVELENLAQFGFPGLILFAGAIGAAGVGRCERAGSGRSRPVVDDHADRGAYWLVHASVDWSALSGDHRPRPCSARLGLRIGPSDRSATLPRGSGPDLARRPRRRCSRSPRCPLPQRAYVNAAYDNGSPTRRVPTTTSIGAHVNPLSIEPLLAEGADRAGRKASRGGRSTPTAARPTSAPRNGRPTTTSPSSTPGNRLASPASSLRSPNRGIHTTPRHSPRGEFPAERQRQADPQADPAGEGPSAEADHPVLKRHRHGLSPRPRPELGLRISNVRLHASPGKVEHPAICSSVAPAASRVSTSRSREVGPPRPKRDPLLTSAARLRVLGAGFRAASTSPGVDSVAERISRWRPAARWPPR